MKLLLKRHSETRRLGVLAFKLYARLEVSEDELSCLDQCNLLNEPVIESQVIKTDSILSKLFELSENKKARLYGLIQGHTFVCERLDEFVALEQMLLKSTTTLQRYVTMAKTFGSEEVIDLERLAEDE